MAFVEGETPAQPGWEQPLTSRLIRVGRPTLEAYLEQGGLVGAQRAARFSRVEALTELRTSALRERGLSAQPLYLTWQRFLEQPGPGLLVVEARPDDPRSLVERALITGNPYLLVEGLIIAALITGVEQAQVLLSPEQASLAPAIQKAWEEISDRDPLEGECPRLAISILGQGPVVPEGTKVLLHTLETWCQLPLLCSWGAGWFCSLGQAGQGGTKLITVGGHVNSPGLLEAPMGASLWQVLEAAGGLQDQDMAGFQGLALDGGLGGFLALESAATPLAPEELAGLGCAPAPSTVWVLGQGHCMVDETRRVLERIASSFDDQDGQIQTLTLSALRLATQSVLGSLADMGSSAGPGQNLLASSEHMLGQLQTLAWQLKTLGAQAARPLLTSLNQFGPEWAEHLAGRGCPAHDPQPPRLAPCHAGCPAGIDIPSFLAHVGHGRHREAVEVIRRDNPLPYICGLICPAPCEHYCLRGECDQPISIRAMKAVAAEGALSAGGYPLPDKAPASGKRAAIIGAGPAGLTCAWFLALMGHGVTIFEAQEVVGGTMFMGIPSYRLPRAAIEADVSGITAAGVEIRIGQSLGKDFTLDDLRSQGYEAVFLGLGAHCGYRLGLPGENDFPQILDGITFLKSVALGDHTPPAEEVVVVGGGNAAMDAARTCVRLGCRKVTIAYRRTRSEMPAHDEEIESALDEGVDIRFLTVPKTVLGEHGRLTGLSCLAAELGPADASGRRRPVIKEGSDFVIEAGAIIAAIGQELDTACLGPLADDQSVCCRTILTQPRTGQTNLGWLFAGGDAVTGPATVVEAVGAGKRAAQAMDAYLRDEDLASAIEWPRPRAMVEPLDMAGAQRGALAKPSMPMRPPAERVKDFAGAELGLDADMALTEARRCLRCDLCIGCGLCQTACAEVGAHALAFSPTQADRLALFDFARPAGRCIACGACASVCPTGAIEIQREDGQARVLLAGAPLQTLPLERCRVCGAVIGSPAQLQALDRRLSPAQLPAAPHLDGLCPACARASLGRGLAGLRPGQG